MMEKREQWLPPTVDADTAEEAKEREAAVIESGETKLYTLQPVALEGAPLPEILVGARDAGPARSLIPVIQALIEKGHPISFLVDQPAEGLMQAAFKDLKEVALISPLAALAKRRPGLILSCISGTGNPGIEFYAEETAKGDGEVSTTHTPTVMIEDFWRVASQDYVLKSGVTPDSICCFDEASRAMDLERLHAAGITTPAPEQFVVTGSPAFDELARETHRDAITKRVREGLHLDEGEVLVMYVGGGPPKDLENLRIFIESMNQADVQQKRVALTARIPPGIFGEGLLAQYRREYERILGASTQARNVPSMGIFSTDEIAIASDIVVSAYSTEGIKAVYRGKTSIFMLLPGLGADGLKEAVGMETLPVIESGGSIGIFKNEDMLEGIARAFNPTEQEHRREAQKKYHTLDGRNTERVVAVIESALTTSQP